MQYLPSHFHFGFVKKVKFKLNNQEPFKISIQLKKVFHIYIFFFYRIPASIDWRDCAVANIASELAEVKRKKKNSSDNESSHGTLTSSSSHQALRGSRN